MCVCRRAQIEFYSLIKGPVPVGVDHPSMKLLYKTKNEQKSMEKSLPLSISSKIIIA